MKSTGLVSLSQQAAEWGGGRAARRTAEEMAEVWTQGCSEQVTGRLEGTTDHMHPQRQVTDVLVQEAAPPWLV